MTAPDKRLPFYRHRSFRRAALFAGVPVVASCLFFSPRVFAGPGWEGARGRHGFHGPRGPMHAQTVEELREHLQGRLDHLLDRVDATDAQRVQAARITEHTAPELFALHEQGQTLREQLKAALLADDIDQAKVRSLGEEIEATVGQATRVGIESMGALAAVLDKSQRKQVGEFFARMGH